MAHGTGIVGGERRPHADVPYRKKADLQALAILIQMNIVFIHQGNEDYLSVALQCARRSNPEADIFLIGDESNDVFDFVRHFNIKDYFDGANQLAKVYKHFSSNSYQFELFCIQRWFILRDFMHRQNLSDCFYADSDVLIFADLKVEWQKFSRFDFTLSEGMCGHNSFWNSREALDNFCSFVENIYSRKDQLHYDKMINIWEEIRRGGNAGGICDMTFLGFYRLAHPEKVGEMTAIIDGSTYDHSISSDRNGDVTFVMQGGVKKIFWKDGDGRPWGLLQGSKDQFVAFNTLHFQGRAKLRMERVFLRKKMKPSFIFFLKRLGVDTIYHRVKIKLKKP
jgi:hypothetical protein